METDPKGQLGGLESSDAVRRRLAVESRDFKCPSCGKTNAEIMRESAQAADSCPIAKQDIEIPSALKMAWKDEMTSSISSTNQVETDDKSRSPSASAHALDLESTSTANDVPVRPTDEEATSRLRVTSGVPAPDLTVTDPHQSQLTRNPIRAEAIPLWVDRVIIMIAGILIAILIKVFIT